ncbi:MAG: tripartite tricarboxylate transporter substrate binding protein [Burkholderiaceae bacterium]|nr:tripartite tricarboxylate transporter substrate binding protein [Burkholderiaceae bacterium]
MRRRLGLAALSSLPAWGLQRPAGAAEPRPERSMRLLLAYPAGGVSDEVARLLAAGLGPRLGATLRVEPLPGAGGTLAMEALARAPADGSVLAFSAITPLSVMPQLLAQRFDAQRDIAPVAAVMATPALLLGTPALPVRRFDEMLALARQQPERLRWATSGLGTTGHLLLAQVQRASGARFTHVPYKGGGQQLADALGGQFELLSSNVAAQQIAHVQAGRLQALAVGAPQRLAVLPEVATLAELGLPEANLVSVFGLFAPGATPPALLERLNAEVEALLAAGPLRERLLATANLPLGGSRAALAQRIAEDRARHRPVLRDLQGPAR